MPASEIRRQGRRGGTNKIRGVCYGEARPAGTNALTTGQDSTLQKLVALEDRCARRGGTDRYPSLAFTEGNQSRDRSPAPAVVRRPHRHPRGGNSTAMRFKAQSLLTAYFKSKAPPKQQLRNDNIPEAKAAATSLVRTNTASCSANREYFAGPERTQSCPVSCFPT